MDSSFEGFLLLFTSVQNSSGNETMRSVTEFTAELSKSVALRVYSNTRPYNLKIAGLQKGLVFVHEGAEQVGEGGGFGLPILIYQDETYFSGLSAVSAGRKGSVTWIQKAYLMDHVNRTKFKNVSLHSAKARIVMKQLAALYRKNKFLQFLALRELSLSLGVESVYLKKAPVGRLVVNYEIAGQTVNVTVDCSQINRKGLEKIVVLNEQSANFFRIYQDSNETQTIDGQIPSWERVTSEWACLMNPDRRIGYRLWDIENGLLHRGRETLPNFLDWAGLDYEFLPQKDFFEYKIQLLGVNS
jgi:hypothetical protein